MCLNFIFRPVFKMMLKYMCLVLFITWNQLADCHPAKNTDVKSIDSMIEKVRRSLLNNYILSTVIFKYVETTFVKLV